MTFPAVSIIMSVYNPDRFFPGAVAGILNQTFGDFEFLIIDDGSAEPICPLVDQFHDPRIVVHRQGNVGLTRSLNRGLILARGALIARMDADDVSLPARLAAQVAAMEANSRLDLVGTFFDVVDGHGALIERKELILDPVYRLWRLQFHNTYGHGTMVMRKRSIIEAGMYDARLRYAQDFELWSRVSRRDNTAIIPEALYQYRMVQDGAQASVRNYEAQLATAIEISDRSLKACNPILSEADCIEVRALYWKFQRERLSEQGLTLVPETLAGFCRRYRIEKKERARLVGRVVDDVAAEAEASRLTGHNDIVSRLEALV